MASSRDAPRDTAAAYAATAAASAAALLRRALKPDKAPGPQRRSTVIGAGSAGGSKGPDALAPSPPGQKSGSDAPVLKRFLSTRKLGECRGKKLWESADSL